MNEIKFEVLKTNIQMAAQRIGIALGEYLKEDHVDDLSFLNQPIGFFSFLPDVAVGVGGIGVCAAALRYFKGALRTVKANERVARITFGNPDYPDYGPGEGNVELFGRRFVLRAPGWGFGNLRWQEYQTITTNPVEISSPNTVEFATKDGVPGRMDASASVALGDPRTIYALDSSGHARIEPRSQSQKTRSQKLEDLLDASARALDGFIPVAHGSITPWTNLFPPENRLQVLDTLRLELQRFYDQQLFAQRDPLTYEFLQSTLPALGIDRRELGSPALAQRLPPGTNRQRGIVVRSVYASLWEIDPGAYAAQVARQTAAARAESQAMLLEGVGGNVDAYRAAITLDTLDRVSARTNSVNLTLGLDTGGWQGAQIGRLAQLQGGPIGGDQGGL